MIGKRPFNQIIILIGILWLSISNADAQHFLKTKGKFILNESNDTILLRGMGLGGWMLQEGYMLQTASFANAQHQLRKKIEDLIGPERTQLFYDAWLKNHVTKSDIDSLKSWGFNSVRLPMHYNLYTLPIEDEPVAGEDTWLEKGFEMTDELIDWCKENEMYVILDLHAAPGGQGQDMGISDYDPSKPSLWQSQENQRKTVALWKRLAERYADEQWVAGYDLINETNWNLNGNIALAQLYQQTTDAIREVDDRHIIFIEGNWFANDFTGLTPPWDDNMVYSPHKYWSTNDVASIQWVLDLRDTYNVPLYLGESGENSNTWFTDAISLLESEKIGWAWWPMKKVESISGPLSVTKTDAYQALLDYWNGSGQSPSSDDAFATLMELTENLKIENCIFQKDVIDAMFRQVRSNETLPFAHHPVPGVVYATNYDLGPNGHAYSDQDVATYHVSTGQYTAWNTGWQYRNDGVDIELCDDAINSNGYNVGWIDAEEWMQYEIDVQEAGKYNILLRAASASGEGKFHFSVDGVPISDQASIPSTGDWVNWETVILSNIILEPQDKKLRFHADEAGFNLSSFEFVLVEPSSNLKTRISDARTVDDRTITLGFNKNLEGALVSPDDFEVRINGETVAIEEAFLNIESSRSIRLMVDRFMISTDQIRVSYSGNEILALDGSKLENFSLEPVLNTLPPIFTLPGRLEMEDFFIQSGVVLETTTDIGGGSNIGFLDQGDYLDYKISVEFSDTFDIDFRVASEMANGACELILIGNGTQEIIASETFPATGGWQQWSTFATSSYLEEGNYVLRFLVKRGPFNVNWIEFKGEAPEPEMNPLGISIYPNPVAEVLNLRIGFTSPHNLDIEIFNALGQRTWSTNRPFITSGEEQLDITELNSGMHYLVITLENDERYVFNFVKH